MEECGCAVNFHLELLDFDAHDLAACFQCPGEVLYSLKFVSIPVA